MPSLALRLRAATAEAHAALEQHLDLLAAPRAARMAAVLAGFRGFHAAWEPAVARQTALAELTAGRRRLHLLDADLSALGLSRGAIAALPVCDAAASLAATEAGALGSLYVLEGSTLGGRVIGKALADLPGLPPQGLAYFNPYGPRTGPMWRALQGALDAPRDAAEAGRIEAAAVQTFALLRAWLPRAQAVALSA